MYLEGSDQHRGWFHSSLLESCGTRGRAPFETILSHGFVVDGKGLKMSKSLGNVISPDEILKKYGADILRIWVTSSNYAEDLRIDHEILNQHAESYRKIRNTFRYILGNLNDVHEKISYEDLEIQTFNELEQYMLFKMFEFNMKFKKYFNEYNFHNLYKDLLNFCTTDLSAFYFDIRKDLLYCDSKESEKRKDCIKVLNIILDCLLKWFAPILSFTTEEINLLISKKDTSIHLEQFPNIPKTWDNKFLNKKWNKIKEIRDKCNLSIESKRSEKILGSSLEADVLIQLSKKDFDLVSNVDFSEICITSSAKLVQIDTQEIIIETSKAAGSKCTLCWKIKKDKCSRQNCPV